MIKFFLSIFILSLVACNSNSKDSSAATDSTNAVNTTAKTYTWTDEEEKDFLAGCVDNAKVRLSDTAAYAYCKCVLGQLKQAFPNMDTAAVVLMDSTKAAVYVGKCK